MGFRKISLLFHTVRNLKVKQIYFRLYYRLRKVQLRSVPDVSLRAWPNTWSAPRWCKRSTSDAVAFNFLGVTGTVRCQKDWQSDRHSKLWLYNLHYLNDLDAEDIEGFPGLADMLITNWIEANPPLSGNGWEPYPISLRIVNLIKWFARGNACFFDVKSSLAKQTDVLMQQIEYHILGNHLFANGKALVFAGAFLEGPESDAWLTKGLRILDKEIPEQFLTDGAHFELSPMYHATLIWDMCDLINLAQCSELPSLESRLNQWRKVVSRGLNWLRSMQHPDGGIPFFNDAAFGGAPTYEQLAAYAGSLGIFSDLDDFPMTQLNAHSGYAVVVPDKHSKAIIDLAEVGPKYQPGHAHADTLSFELSLYGQRFLVNSGTSQYGEDSERQRQRSTSAHNTVEIAEMDSSEVWAGFRVARRARPTIESFEEKSGHVFISASHNGYKRLTGKHLHRRTWDFTPLSLEVVDHVTGDEVVAVSRLYVHPDVKVSLVSTGLIADLVGGHSVSIEILGADEVRLTPSTWHPEFGCSVPNQCIEAFFSNGSLITRIGWSEF
ncbi:heparinase II/III family protein [Serpens gallinarum]|uniref:Alginate lyase family protein n=1 Tax=Serpens gallinarum TaxID=2763075 RepID=A0ABR8TSU9_9PSED|nr:alginate lyase family protein [Serpens gallinarum]MBD7978570.1 alginate lyase family protein [Serpens gallinarum]